MRLPDAPARTPRPRRARRRTGALLAPLAGGLATLAALAPALLAAPAPAPALSRAALTTTSLVPVRATAAAGPDLGYDRIGVRRGGTWRLRDSLDGGPARLREEESAGWLPVAGDLDGDGASAPSLFRDGVWRLRDAEGGPVRTVRFGARGDVPVLGDWDGDGVDTLGLFRHGRWFLRASNGAGPAPYRTFGFGLGGDLPVVGDWDADGSTDLAVTRGASWYQRDDASPGPATRTFRFGRAGDLPVAGDWDHDGRDTPGLFRAGTWFLEVGNGFGGYRTTAFGAAGDRPVVRRTPGLADGTTHAVVRYGGSVAHVVSVRLSASSSPDVVLSGGTLGGLETTSSMARRTGAAVAVNGDYFLTNGRPVHALAVDGRLLQTPQLLGRALSLDATGTRVRMGYPDTRVVLRPSATATTVSRWNSGGPLDGGLVGHTAIGAGLDVPPDGSCYAGGTTGRPDVRPDGGVDATFTVTGTRCLGPSPHVGPGSTVLTAAPGTPGEGVVRDLRVGQAVPTTSYLGFPGAVDVLGGTPLLLVAGQPQTPSLVGGGDFFARQPRTAVGTTADGRLLVVVVDGRQPGYSAGVTLGELAGLMGSLGATDALNLDGGGSSTMVVDGVVANRPSDGFERGVATALVVLPADDPGQQDLRVAGRLVGGVAGTARTRGRAALRAGSATAPAGSAGPRAAGARAARDPGSTGGLADALQRAGVPLPSELRRVDAVYDAAHP